MTQHFVSAQPACAPPVSSHFFLGIVIGSVGTLALVLAVIAALVFVCYICREEFFAGFFRGDDGGDYHEGLLAGLLIGLTSVRVDVEPIETPSGCSAADIDLVEDVDKAWELALRLNAETVGRYYDVHWTALREDYLRRTCQP